MKLLLISIAIFALGTNCSFSQNNSALELAKYAFSRDSVSNLRDYSTGEFTGNLTGKDIPLTSQIEFVLLEESDNVAVVAVSIIDSANARDFYLHMIKRDGWKIQAIRALRMTGVLREKQAVLEALSREEAEEILSNVKQRPEGNYLFRSLEEYKFLLENYRLVLSSDQGLIDHFTNNFAELEQLKSELMNNSDSIKSDEIGEEKGEMRFTTRCHELGVTSLSVSEYGVNILIGGLSQNYVGYIYVVDPKYKPEMFPDMVIMVRKISDGWYLYKTISWLGCGNRS